MASTDKTAKAKTAKAKTAKAKTAKAKTAKAVVQLASVRDVPSEKPAKTPKKQAGRRVWVTGGGGYVGRQVVSALAEMANVAQVISTDLRLPDQRLSTVQYEVGDIRDNGLVQRLIDEQIDTVIHLAAVVTPKPDDSRQLLYEIDVDGTENVLSACVKAGVKQFVYTSSGAAYGYHADNAALLDEDAPLRGNQVFAYSYHKRLVEEMLARYRTAHPALGQLVFRVSTVLGPTVNNQITAMFERPVVVGVKGSDTPFCFVADEDVVGSILHGVDSGAVGTFNLTGDGVMTLREVAVRMGKRYVAVPEPMLRRALKVLSDRQLTGLGPEQIIFLKHRPVLDNAALKCDFGYRPARSSRQVFERYRSSRV
ncbi:MAG: SDR family oxidoreductase [Myxococcales bacterium]|nr:SDR family oxidoreductase [Myxococcales bacterium]